MGGNGVLVGRRGFVGLASAASVAAAAAVASSATAATVARGGAQGGIWAGGELLGDPRDDLSAITARLRSLDGRLGPRYVLDEALAHQSLVVALLRQARSSRQRRQLAFEAADITGFIGWLAFDTGAFDASFAHYRAAASLAEEAGDSGFHAWVLGSEALSLIHLGNDEEAIGVLEAAQQVAADRACQSTRTWLASTSCHVHARLGDRHAAWKAYGMAEKLVDVASADGVPSWLSWLHPAGSRRIIEQVRTVRGSIPRKHAGDRAVRELDERLGTARSIV
jgi:hypothetical protein